MGFRPSICVPDVWLPGNALAPARHLCRGAAAGPRATVLDPIGACAKCDRDGVTCDWPRESGRVWPPRQLLGSRPGQRLLGTDWTPRSRSPHRPRRSMLGRDHLAGGAYFNSHWAPTSQWNIGKKFPILVCVGESRGSFQGPGDLATTHFPSSHTDVRGRRASPSAGIVDCIEN